jgi:hypothetical protein
MVWLALSKHYCLENMNNSDDRIYAKYPDGDREMPLDSIKNAVKKGKLVWDGITIAFPQEEGV